MAGEEANLAKNMLDKMQVHEVVLAGALERPLHHAEQLLDVTLRWGSWPETDRHDKKNRCSRPTSSTRRCCHVLFHPSQFSLRCSSPTTRS